MTEQVPLINEETFKIVAPDQNDLMNKSANLIEQAGRVIIKTDEDLEKSGDVVRFLRAIFKKAEIQRKELTTPLLSTKKKIDADYKKITDPITKAIKQVESVMTVFMNERERLLQIESDKVIKAQEDAALAEAEQVESTEGKDAADAVIEQATTDIALVNNTPIKTTVRGDYGSTTSSQKIRKWRVTDIRKIPIMYLMLDEQMIKDAIRSHKGLMEIEADDKGLKGKERDAFITQEMAVDKFTIPGLEFFFENKARVR